MSVLQNTIIAMKELAVMAQTTNDTFNKESQALVSDIQGQLDAVGQFDDQEFKIKSLQGRIHNGRARIQELSQRVDVVRERIEGWERADREWQERTRKRLKAMWIVMSIVFFAMVLLFLTAQYVTPMLEEVEGVGVGVTQALSSGLGLGSSSPSLLSSPVGNASVSAPPSTSQNPQETEDEEVDVYVPPTTRRDRLFEDERLRLFDEL